MKRKNEANEVSKFVAKQINFSLLPTDMVREIALFNSTNDWKNLGIVNKEIREVLLDVATIRDRNWVIIVPQMETRAFREYTLPNYMIHATKMDITFTHDNFGRNPREFEEKVIEIFKSLPNLIHLICHEPFISGFMSVMNKYDILPKLKTLELHGFNAGHISTKNPNLEYLSVHVDSGTYISTSRRQYIPYTVEIICGNISPDPLSGELPAISLGLDEDDVFEHTGILILKFEKSVGHVAEHVRGAKLIRMEQCVLVCHLEKIKTLELHGCCFGKTRYNRSLGRYDNPFLFDVGHLILHDKISSNSLSEYRWTFDGFIEQMSDIRFKQLSVYRNVWSQDTIAKITKAGIEINYL